MRRGQDRWRWRAANVSSIDFIVKSLSFSIDIMLCYRSPAVYLF